MKTESTKSRALLDTNVLVYAYAEDSSKRHIAVQLLQTYFTGKARGAIALQNIAEFCDAAKRKYRIEPAILERIVKQLLACSDFVKISYRESTLLAAMDISAKKHVHFFDALLAATMLEHNINTIYTEDQDFSKIPGIKAVNPFKK